MHVAVGPVDADLLAKIDDAAFHIVDNALLESVATFRASLLRVKGTWHPLFLFSSIYKQTMIRFLA